MTKAKANDGKKKAQERSPELTVEALLAGDPHAAEVMDALRASDPADRLACLYERYLRRRLKEIDPEAARLDAERNAALERGDEAAADKASAALDARFYRFSDADKGFKDVKRKAKAAARAYAAAMRAEEGDEEDGDE